MREPGGLVWPKDVEVGRHFVMEVIKGHRQMVKVVAVRSDTHVNAMVTYVIAGDELAGEFTCAVNTFLAYVEWPREGE